MFPFFKRRTDEQIVSPEALKARQDAEESYQKALQQQAQAKTVTSELREVNRQNHFAQSLTKTFRRSI